MSSIDNLIDYIKKAAGDTGLPNPVTGSSSSPVKDLSGTPGPAGWGGGSSTSPPAGANYPGKNIDAVNRLYLTSDGFIPGTTSTPKEVGIPFFKGPRTGTFIDKRNLQSHQKEIYEQAHSRNADKKIAYGGIIINDKGQILIREAANKLYFYFIIVKISCQTKTWA